MNCPTKHRTKAIVYSCCYSGNASGLCVGANVWRVRGLALHVCEGLRVASVPAQGNLFAAKCAIMNECLLRLGFLNSKLSNDKK